MSERQGAGATNGKGKAPNENDERFQEDELSELIVM
ncbi:Purkinje cell protein 4, partial [Ophiophagus hannah]